MPRVVGYCRVSTLGQAQEGVSLDAQRERISLWSRARDGSEPAHVYADEGISGKRWDNRPGLAAAIADVTSGPGGILVVYSLSRLARSVRDTLDLAERLERAGADLVSLSESLDTTNAAGKMLFRLLAVLAEFERDLVAERTRGALAHKRSRGERIGQVPYGSRLDIDGVSLRIDPEERLIIDRILRLSAGEGWTPRRIATVLDSEAIPTKNGGRWSHRTVARILAREKNRPCAEPPPPPPYRPPSPPPEIHSPASSAP